MDTPPTPTTENSGSSSKGHACVLCQQRKVKCDRTVPCSACTKSRVECVYRDLAPPRRRKRRTPEDLLIAKVKRYEELLKNAGVKVDNVETAEVADTRREYEDERSPRQQSTNGSSLDHHLDEPKPKQGPVHERTGNDFGTDARPAFQGRLIVEEGRSRYLENKLWMNLSKEVQSFPLPEEEEVAMPPHSNQYEFKPNDTANDILLGNPTKTELGALHPPPAQIWELWQIFLANINPLTHVVHAPTLQDNLSKACGDMSRLSRGLEALMFAIYCSAVNSMSENDCQSILGESRDLVLVRYMFGCRHALINSLWLRSSEMMILQAFTLFLLAVRPIYDPRTLWTLSGVAIRIAQRIGLHRDGSVLGLGVFEAEMRRRLWWQILVLDGRNAELAGSGFSIEAKLSDVQLPLNVNDEDLYPGMAEPPKERTGATEMMFCLLRYNFGKFFKEAMKKMPASKSGFDGIWQSLTNGAVSVVQRDELIDELQELLESKFLRFSDPLNKTHFIAAAVARTALAVMRFKTHLKGTGDDEQKLPQEEKQMLWTTAMKILEYDNLGQSTKSVQGFLWHIRSHFSWDTLIYLLSELRLRTTGLDVERAWQAIEECYGNHPEFLTTISPLHAAIGILAERAWNVRQAELARRHNVPVEAIPPPGFIVALSQRKAKPTSLQRREPQRESYSGNIGITNEGLPFEFASETPQPYLVTPEMDLSPIDWAAWDGMIEDFENHSGTLY